MSSIEERVKKIVVEQLGVKEDEVTANASFVDDLGADSLDTVELVMALERRVRVRDPGRGSREDHHRAAGGRLHQAHVRAEFPPSWVTTLRLRGRSAFWEFAHAGVRRRRAERPAGRGRDQAGEDSMSKRRVVITGLGILSPVGNDIATAWKNIVEAGGIGPPSPSTPAPMPRASPARCATSIRRAGSRRRTSRRWTPSSTTAWRHRLRR